MVPHPDLSTEAGIEPLECARIAGHRADGTCWGGCAFFEPEALGSEAASALLSWRARPLLFPLVRGRDGGVQRLLAPVPERALWSQRFSMLDRELRERHDGYAQAAVALLTLILVDVGRLAASSVADTRIQRDPLLAEVFTVIENRYQEGISLRDVASAVNLTPGYLTTLVRQ